MESGGQPRQIPSARMEKEPHLKDYLSMVAARKWVVISAFLVCVGMTAIYVFVQTPVYRASCRLEIQPASSDATEIKAAYDPTLSEVGGDSIRQAFLKTQFEMILADPVIVKTFRHFKFRDSPAYKQSKNPESSFKKHFAVSPIRDTWLADVTFEWIDPEQAAAVLDYLVKAYLEEYRNRSQGMDRETLSAKKNKLAELGPQVVEKYHALQAFIAENGLVSLEDAPKKVSKRYDDLTEALNAATLKYSEAKSRYEDIRSAIEENRLEEMPEIFENSNIDALKLELVKAQLHLNELEKVFGKRHPEVATTRENVDFIKKRIEFEKHAFLAAAKSEYERAKNTAEDLENLIEKEKEKIGLLNQKLGEYNRLQSDYEGGEKNYNDLKSDINELELALTGGGEKEKNITIVNPAKVPVSPVRPQKAFSILLAALVGLMIGVGLCLLVEYLDTTVKTKDDVDRVLEMPTLGYVPPIGGGQNGESPPELSSLEKPRSLLAESFRSIRTSLMFSKAGRGLKSILVTSAMPMEGKSTVSANIAVALAQAGKRVLLVDGDLRRPRLERMFGLPSDPGLTNILAGEGKTPLDGMLLRTEVANLFLLASGPHPPNPAELLGSEKMGELAVALSKKFDHVVYDSPPALSATDAAIIAQHVDGTVLVVRSFKTERDLAVRARDSLKDAQANILGAVLNNADVPKSGYYGYSGYGGKYYRYYYHPYYYSEDKTKRVRKRRPRKSDGSRKRGSAKEDASGGKGETADRRAAP